MPALFVLHPDRVAAMAASIDPDEWPDVTGGAGWFGPQFRWHADEGPEGGCPANLLQVAVQRGAVEEADGARLWIHTWADGEDDRYSFGVALLEGPGLPQLELVGPIERWPAFADPAATGRAAVLALLEAAVGTANGLLDALAARAAAAGEGR